MSDQWLDEILHRYLKIPTTQMKHSPTQQKLKKNH